MKVILLDEIKGKGGEGDVVEVAQGYAENFLFPKKLAVAATKGNLKQLDERRNNIAKREAVRLATANETKAAFEGKTVTVDVKVGDEGILFGSVTAAMIADAIKAQLGMDIDRKRVELGKPIKVAGAHTVAISLYREIKAEVVVLVGVTAEELAAEAEVEEAAEVAEAETAEQLAVLLLFFFRHAPGKTAALAAAGGEGEVLFDPHRGGGAHHRVLEHAADILCALVVGQRGDVLAVEDDAPVIHRPDTGHSVEHGGFTGSVAADDRDEIAVFKMEVNAVERYALIYCAFIEGFTYVYKIKHRSPPPFFSVSRRNSAALRGGMAPREIPRRLSP